MRWMDDLEIVHIRVARVAGGEQEPAGEVAMGAAADTFDRFAFHHSGGDRHHLIRRR